jgi:hypothetical protein
MDKVYVVTEGDYSDYHIVAVFTTEEVAEEYAKKRNEKNGYESARVEDYEVNESSATMPHWFVRMFRDGTVERVQSEGDDLPTPADSWVQQMNMPVKDMVMETPERVAVLAVRCCANDEQHAVKIANEIRVQRIALNQFSTE